jgi:hypothetical protein
VDGHPISMGYGIWDGVFDQRGTLWLLDIGHWTAFLLNGAPCLVEC